jgi:uncharacterized membrane protein YobD (UPF0266 family)
MSNPSIASSLSSVATSNRIIGLVILIVGVVIVIVAITLAYNAYYNYVVPEIKGETIEEIIASLMRALVDIAIRLGFLGIIVWAAGILLKHGVSLLK